jgi:copper(I)-binding protein
MTRAAALLLTIFVALVAGCSSSSASPTAAAGGFLTVKGVWTRPAPAGADTAVYFTIVNGKVDPDTLVGASTDAAQMASIHQTTTDASGMTGMQPASSVTIPGGGTVSFAPGGYHVMLTGLKQELKVGDQVKVTLTFENAGVVTVSALVQAQ